jgi:hypothetical protein
VSHPLAHAVATAPVWQVATLWPHGVSACLSSIHPNSDSADRIHSSSSSHADWSDAPPPGEGHPAHAERERLPQSELTSANVCGLIKKIVKGGSKQLTRQNI